MIVLVHMNQMLDPMKPTVTSNRKCHILGLLGSTNPGRISLLEYWAVQSKGPEFEHIIFIMDAELLLVN